MPIRPLAAKALAAKLYRPLMNIEDNDLLLDLAASVIVHAVRIDEKEMEIASTEERIARLRLVKR